MSPEEIQALLDLEPEELAIQMLANLKQHVQSPFSRRDDSFSFANIYNTVEHTLPKNSPQDKERNREVYLAYMEAWAWLESNALIIWSDPVNGSNGFRVLSRRAKRLDANELRLFANASGLSREHLHPRIEHAVWSEFIRGQFDMAVFLAAKAVEVAVKEKTNMNAIGVTLMRKAFKPGTGPLADTSIPIAEQEARMGLFAGFIGCYKNPGSHRDVNLENPLEAMQVALFASHLLSIVDPV